ncbi:DUF6326 family protein [Actinophytocola xanthii]|uniref:DoxX family protein n=1 Tax=Actinophytocola xanthii TaxID=1912961 RepID=A0A1Q8CGA6_9PSEU|nr:DUF6326 family protein [Actinophytocola xanthii]OLF13350.1 hypothetical protein BU204_27945 [Actinophytocola xanthii]
MTNSNPRVLDPRRTMSTLWIVVLFNMLFADVLGFVAPGTLAEMATGYAGSLRVTPEILLVFAVLLEIPIAMVFLSRVLGYRANRLANIAAAVMTIAFTVGGGTTDPHYVFLAGMEVVCMTAIIRIAWTWREPADVS